VTPSSAKEKAAPADAIDQVNGDGDGDCDGEGDGNCGDGGDDDGDDKYGGDDNTKNDEVFISDHKCNDIDDCGAGS
jgi:hypothetical protein